MNTTSSARPAPESKWAQAGVRADWPILRFGAISDAWGLYRRYWKVWSLTMLVSLLAVGLGNRLAGGVLDVSGRGTFGGLIGLQAPGAPMLSVILGAMIGGFFLGGMVRMAINQIHGRAPRVEDLFSVTDVWFDLILGAALLAMIVTIGLQLLVLPGLAALGVFLFMFPLIVDGRTPATGAMIQSFHALKSQWLLALAMHFVLSLVAGSGTLLLGIGLLVTGPLYPLTLAVLYRDLYLNPLSSTWSKPRGDYDEF